MRHFFKRFQANERSSSLNTVGFVKVFTAETLGADLVAFSLTLVNFATDPPCLC